MTKSDTTDTDEDYDTPLRRETDLDDIVSELIEIDSSINQSSMAIISALKFVFVVLMLICFKLYNPDFEISDIWMSPINSLTDGWNYLFS
ncbi:MAG: hypothetical protein V7727_13520 [Sneathiella sp.]